jgi:hypothetical protein
MAQSYFVAKKWENNAIVSVSARLLLLPARG